jgi:dihydrofolate reductase
MRKLVVIEFVTLDGVVQGLGSPDEDRDGGFEHGGWGAPYLDETQGAAAVEGLASTTAYLFGRKTYEKMAAFWPHQPGDNPLAAHLNATPKYVATRTLTSVGWANARVLAGDLVPAVKDLQGRDARPGAPRGRPRRRVPAVPAPAPARYGQEAVQGPGPAAPAAARRPHGDDHGRPHAHVRPGVTRRAPRQVVRSAAGRATRARSSGRGCRRSGRWTGSSA